MSSEVISIRSIQHFLYCPHRWGLIEIGKIWSENFYVTKSNFLHKRVHESGSHYISKCKKVFMGVSVYNDSPEYNIYGVVDCIEFCECKTGIQIDNTEKKYKPCIVEYKPTKPKNSDYNYDELMQVFAQKLCVDFIFKCDSEATIYYCDVKKRVRLPIRKNFEIYNNNLKNQLITMRKFLKLGKIPKISKFQNCSGCSMKDICIPKIKEISNFRKNIIQRLKSEEA